MTKKGQKQAQKPKIEKELEVQEAEQSGDAFDEEVNSGFGNYLRSSSGEIFSGRSFSVVSLVAFLNFQLVSNYHFHY